MRSVPRAALLIAAGAALLAGVEPASAQEAAVADDVPTAARDLPRGAVLVAADVAFPSGAPDSVAAPIGWVTRRVVSEGEPLRAPAISPPELVKVGQPVQLLWSSGALELRLVGRAMASGAEGERVMVRVDLRRRFEGVVVGPGLVRMESPERSRT